MTIFIIGLINGMMASYSLLPALAEVTWIGMIVPPGQLVVRLMNITDA